jgi:hypothetical protein
VLCCVGDPSSKRDALCLVHCTAKTKWRVCIAVCLPGAACTELACKAADAGRYKPSMLLTQHTHPWIQRRCSSWSLRCLQTLKWLGAGHERKQVTTRA